MTIQQALDTRYRKVALEQLYRNGSKKVSDATIKANLAGVKMSYNVGGIKWITRN